MSILSNQQIDEFQQFGVVILRGVFADWMTSLRKGIEFNMQNPGPFAREYMDQNEAGRFFGDYCNWDRIHEYKQFMFDSPGAQIAAELTLSTKMRIFHEHVLVKEPGTDKVTPWHHDQPYYPVEGFQVCSLWIPLDFVAQQTCPEFIAGSHRWGRWFTPRRFTGNDYPNEDPRFESIPDFDSVRDQHDIRSWDLEPGDAIAFHFLTVHAAPSNLSTKGRRRAFAARWLGDDAVYAKRSGIISPPFPGLDERLKSGDQMDTEEFPLAFKA